jgi:tetratricopeptide (TPR) repeat protein
MIDEWKTRGTADDWSLEDFKEFYGSCLQRLFSLDEQNGQQNALIAYLNSLIQTSSPNSLQQACFLALKAQTELSLKETESGEKDFRAAINLIHGTGATADLIRVTMQNKFALCLVHVNQLSEADSLADKSLQELAKYPSRSFELAEATLAKSKIFEAKKQYPQAIATLHERMRYLKEILIGHEAESCNLMRDLSNLYIKAGEKRKAAAELEDAAKLISLSGSLKEQTEGQAVCWSAAGELYLSMNNLAKASDCEKKIRECFPAAIQSLNPNATGEPHIKLFLLDMQKRQH